MSQTNKWRVPANIFRSLSPALSRSDCPKRTFNAAQWPKIVACVPVLFAVIFVTSTPIVFAQSAAVPSAQTELTSFEKQALLASSPAAVVPKSITLTGNVVWIAGSLREAGTVLLTASSDGSISESWSLPSQSHNSVATALGSGRSCKTTDAKGTIKKTSDPNCWRPIPWFAPWIGLHRLSTGSVIGLDSTKPEDRAVGSEKLTFQQPLPTVVPMASALKSQLSQMQTRAAATISYDRSTALPSSLQFDQILDSDPAHVINNNIVFSDFRPEGGFILPHRIQRYIQRTLQADITITAVNSK